MNKTELDKKCDNCHFRLMMAETVEQLAEAKARHETLVEAVKGQIAWLTEELGEWACVQPHHYPNDHLINVRTQLDEMEEVLKQALNVEGREKIIKLIGQARYDELEAMAEVDKKQWRQDRGITEREWRTDQYNKLKKELEGKMKTLEQAILKLPEIDKRWETKTITNGNTHKKYCFASFGIPGKKYIMVTERGNYIETYHAAALTLGYEIHGVRMEYKNAKIYI